MGTLSRQDKYACTLKHQRYQRDTKVRNIVNFNIQKLKSKHTSLKNIQTEQNRYLYIFSHFEGTRGGKTQ